jgi:hypothetical protein
MAGTALAIGLGLGAAKADPILVNGGWYGFCIFDAGGPAEAGCQNEASGEAGNTFTFTALETVLLQLTDAYVPGDTFRLVLDGVDYFSSAPGTGDIVTEPGAAFAAGYFSTLSLELPAGSYSFDIFGESIIPPGAAGYVRVSTPVPEPGTLALLGAGMIGLVGFGRRRAAPTAG